MTTITTFTLFGTVVATFGETGGPAVSGPPAAVALLAERMLLTPDHRGMMVTLESCDPASMEHITATAGFGLVPVTDDSEPPEVAPNEPLEDGEFDAEAEWFGMDPDEVDALQVWANLGDELDAENGNGEPT